MIRFDEAVALIQSVARPLASEAIPLASAAARVLAAPVSAKIDAPRSAVSSMDGYAVRAKDLREFPAELKVVGTSYPGLPFGHRFARGECVRIFTGAPVPDGASHVVIQEDVARAGELAILSELDRTRSFIRSQGSDFRAGDLLLREGTLLDARTMVAAAGGDNDCVNVFRRARVRVVSTGDELVEPGMASRTPHAVPESVSLGVATLAERYGACCEGRMHLKDDLRLIQSAAEQALADADLVVLAGGASVGERDFAKDMFTRVGLRLIFSGVAMRPGKPVWFGRIQDQLILGLPGNPTSALVTARLLMVPLLELMRGRPITAALSWKTAPLGSSLGPCGDRETFHRAAVIDGAAQVLRFDDSGAQKTLAEAAILVRQQPDSPSLERGDLVQVLDF